MAGSVLIPSGLRSETALLTTTMEASTTHSWVRVFTPVVLPAWNNFPWIVLWIPHHNSVCVLSCFSRVRLCATPWTVACQAPLSMGFPRQENWSGEAVLRWQRNRTGRPLSPRQIHQKNIWILSKFYKTTFECWQRTSDTQKSSPLSSKGGRKKI